MKLIALLGYVCPVLVLSCGGSDGTAPPTAVFRVAVTLSSSNITVGGTSQATAVASDASGAPLTGRSFTWSSSASAIASVGLNGLVTGVSPGSATINATSGMVSGSASLTVVSPTDNPDATTSYTYQKTNLYISYAGIRGNASGFVLAVAYADFNQDGRTDVFLCPGNGSQTAMPCELYLNTGSSFQLSSIPGNPGLVHARKALVGDFNSDGRPDVFVAGHGYDQPPYAGEAPLLLLSSQTGLQKANGLDSYVGFHHGGASGDIDGDGKLDVVLTGASPLLLLGQGNGQFIDGSARLPVELQNKNMYTMELRDVDKDGYLDLLVAGHEQDGFAGRILWGSSTGVFTFGNSTVLPAVPNYGVTIDIDVEDIDGDGDRDIVLTRTGSDGTQGFYQGYFIQVIKCNGGRQFIDVPANAIVSPGGTWFPWIRLQDQDGNGSPDILVDDAGRGLKWLNDGAGRFMPG